MIITARKNPGKSCWASLRSRRVSVDLNLLHAEIESHLVKIQELLPETYKLTLLARCTNDELADADIMLTIDTLPEIERAVQKRMKAKES